MTRHFSQWSGGLLVGPCIVLGALGYRYSHAAAFGIWRVMLCAFSWSLPLTWVLAVVGVGHGGMALFFPAWFALGGSLLADSSGTLVYPSLLLTPLLPIVAFVATAYYMRFRRARRARAERSVVRWRG